VPVVANQEIFLSDKKITSQAMGTSYTFPSNLTPPTGLKHLLLATQSFADLPGAPTPDFIIPPNFFSPAGDTLKWHVYDVFTFNSAEFPAALHQPHDPVGDLERPRRGVVGPQREEVVPQESSAEIEAAELGVLQVRAAFDGLGELAEVAVLVGGGTRKEFGRAAELFPEPGPEPGELPRRLVPALLAQRIEGGEQALGRILDAPATGRPELAEEETHGGAGLRDVKFEHFLT